MVLNLVNQLRFTRMEFRRGFEGVSEHDGSRRMVPINNIAWIVGHMAWHEQYYWLKRAQGQVLFPDLDESAAFGKDPGVVSLGHMTAHWKVVTAASDGYLSGLTLPDLERHMRVGEKELPFNIGTMIQRVIYHYWYHCGEMQALRQLMRHQNLPQFVSDEIETTGSYYLDKTD